MALEDLNIEELCVVNGANRLFSCLDERFPDLETHYKIGESLDDVFRLKVDKGERTTYCGVHRPLSRALGSGTQGYRSGSRGTVIHGAKVAQALRSTFPANLGVTKEFVHVMDECVQKKPVSQAKVLVTRDDLSARRQRKTLDELLLEIEQLSLERASHVSVESDDEQETCLLLHEPGKAIIDGLWTMCYWGTDAGSSSVCDGRSGKRDCLAL